MNGDNLPSLNDKGYYELHTVLVMGRSWAVQRSALRSAQYALCRSARGSRPRLRACVDVPMISASTPPTRIFFFNFPVPDRNPPTASLHSPQLPCSCSRFIIEPAPSSPPAIAAEITYGIRFCDHPLPQSSAFHCQRSHCHIPKICSDR